LAEVVQAAPGDADDAPTRNTKEMTNKQKTSKRGRTAIPAIFSPETVAKLGHYVCALVDPRMVKTNPRRMFYVGKGKGNRFFWAATAPLACLPGSRAIN